MLITFTVSCIVLSVIFGYSLIFKQFLLNKKNILINNIDFIYGIFLLTLISLTLNFFFPLKIFTIPICIIGLFFFLYGFSKKKFNFNFLFLFLFLFPIIFISYFNGNNVD